jgi:hypothetical protein
MSKPSGGEGVCNCCQQPICGGPTLDCDSISASKSKCGFQEYSGYASTPPKYYLRLNRRYTRTDRSHYTQPVCDEVNADVDEDRSYELVMNSSTCQQTATGCPLFVFGEPWNGVRTVTRTEDWFDPLTPCHHDEHETYTWVCGDVTIVVTESPTGCPNSCECGSVGCHSGCSDTVVTTTTATSQTIATTYTPDLFCPGGGGQTAFHSRHEQDVTTLSDEFTTAMLIANTIAALNHYTPTFGGDRAGFNSGDCSAFRNLSSTESSYSIRRTKYRVRHQPTASSYLRVWLRKRFRPVGTFGSSDVLTDLADYIWTGTPSSGNLSMADSSHRYSDVQNQINGDIREELEPAENGTATVEIKKWSCVQGYTPDDPQSSGARPFPDNNPNGFPAQPAIIPVTYPHL